MIEFAFCILIGHCSLSAVIQRLLISCMRCRSSWHASFPQKTSQFAGFVLYWPQFDCRGWNNQRLFYHSFNNTWRNFLEVTGNCPRYWEIHNLVDLSNWNLKWSWWSAKMLTIYPASSFHLICVICEWVSEAHRQRRKNEISSTFTTDLFVLVQLQNTETMNGVRSHWDHDRLVKNLSYERWNRSSNEEGASGAPIHTFMSIRKWNGPAAGR